MLALLLLALLPLQDAQTVNRADVIELNHFYDHRTGQEVFRQWLFWELKNDGEFELIDWRLCKGEVLQGDLLMVDGKFVKGASHRETWTDYDPELEEREKKPKEKRKGIR